MQARRAERSEALLDVPLECCICVLAILLWAFGCGDDWLAGSFVRLAIMQGQFFSAEAFHYAVWRNSPLLKNPGWAVHDRDGGLSVGFAFCYRGWLRGRKSAASQYAGKAFQPDDLCRW